jgi:hypothetical protein
MIPIKTLENVKVGDAFAVKIYGDWRIVTCAKVTEKQCVIDKSSYRKSDARELGTSKSWASKTLFSRTEEVDVIIRKTALIRSIDLKNITLSRWSEEGLIALKVLMDKQTELTS